MLFTCFTLFIVFSHKIYWLNGEKKVSDICSQHVAENLHLLRRQVVGPRP